MNFRRALVALAIYLISLKNTSFTVISHGFKQICEKYFHKTIAVELEKISNEIFEFYYKIKFDNNYSNFQAVFTKHSNFFDCELRGLEITNLTLEEIGNYFN
jgi:hypothetical protein